MAHSGVFFDQRGSGRDVLMLHGNPDTCELWAPVADRLGTGFRCILPDLPGFGRSEAPSEFDASLDAMAEWVAGVLEAADAGDEVDLVGHDFGAIFGIAWAIRHPERVRRIAVGGFPFFPDYRWHFWGRVWRTPLLGELSLAMMNWWLFRREMKRGGPGLDEEYVRRAYEALTPATMKMIPKLYRAADPENFAALQDGLEALARTVPMMIVWGELDPFIPACFARRFGSDTVHVLPGVGHWFPAEAPDEVAGLLRQFLGGPG
jgi:pimeloyl-ACP methyl ester carboxylesterase